MPTPTPTHDLIVKRSRAGLGLYTKSAIKKGDFIIAYTGEIISDAEANRRGGKYLFTINKTWTIDGKERANTARYINHSCRPNSEVEVYGRKREVKVFAKRNIKPGEEITYDYGKEYCDEYIKPTGCRCDKCVGTQTSK